MQPVDTCLNKQAIDQAIHAIVSVKYKNCSAPWREVKAKLAEDESGFNEGLKDAFGKIQ